MNRRALDVAPILSRLRLDSYDVSAWGELYDKLYPYGFAIAYRLLRGNGAAAEDVCQEAFFRMLKYTDFRPLDTPSKLIGYFATVVGNEVRNFISSRKGLTEPVSTEAEAELLDAKIDENMPSPQASLQSVQELEQMGQQLNPREFRLAQLLAEGFSLPEIADQLGVPYQGAGVLVHRLRAKLRNRLKL